MKHNTHKCARPSSNTWCVLKNSWLANILPLLRNTLGPLAWIGMAHGIQILKWQQHPTCQILLYVWCGTWNTYGPHNVDRTLSTNVTNMCMYSRHPPALWCVLSSFRSCTVLIHDVALSLSYYAALTLSLINAVAYVCQFKKLEISWRVCMSLTLLCYALLHTIESNTVMQWASDHYLVFSH